MRFLKKFNESLSKEDLKDFCESSLAYMLDDDFKISCDKVITSAGHDNSNKSMITITKLDGWDPFFYPDYKDHLIPFIQLLSRRYTLESFTNDNKVIMWDYNNKRWVGFTLDQILNVDDPNNKEDKTYYYEDSIFPNTTTFKLKVSEKK
jgi:hypothetical protein